MNQEPRSTSDAEALLFKEHLEGARLCRVLAIETSLSVYEEDWPDPPFVYSDCLRIETERGSLTVTGHESMGDLVFGVAHGPPREADWFECVDGAARRIERVTFGRHEPSGCLDNMVMTLEDGSEIVMFTGELDDDDDGEPCVRVGDEAMFLFTSRAAAARLGCRHVATALEGVVTQELRRRLEPPKARPVITAQDCEPVDLAVLPRLPWPWSPLRGPGVRRS
jgi:hypothetical protein